jgi:hypothetical protein
VRVLPIAISLVCLVCVAVPTHAVARPKPRIAVAPLTGDPGDQVAEAVVDALAGKDFVVVGPKEVGHEMKKLGLSDELDARDTRKLTTRLDVVALVGGKVIKAGKKRSLHLEVHRRGKPGSGFTIEFKSTASDSFRRGVHEEVVKKLDGVAEDSADDDQPKKLAARSADDDDRKRKPADDDDTARRPRKSLADDDDTARRPRKPPDDDDDTARRPRKPPDDDDDTAKRTKKPPDDDDDTAKRPKRVASTDDDEPAVRKRKGRKPAGEDAASQVFARVSAGGLVAQRRLTWDVRTGLTQAQIPPRVITTAAAARVDGELYPFGLANPKSTLAGLGIAAAYDKTFGLSIKIPNQTVQAPIDQAHYAVGARYRFGVGEASAIALGVDYVRRHYIADRSGLMAAILDAPDVDYTAIVPGIAARVPVSPAITMFGELDGMLLLETGAIQKTASYGPATVYGLDVVGGVDIALARQIGLRIALEYSQINFSFNGKGTMTSNRDNDATTQDVMGATDRSIGVAATLGLMY